MNKKENSIQQPPFELKRNKYGLFDHMQYEFDEFGFVNYRKLIPAEFLVPNRDFFQKKEMAIPRTIDGLEDNQILTLLHGWRFLANIRGYNGLDHQVIESSPTSVTVKTTICWIPNYETEYKEICFSSLATSNLANTFNFAQNYLAEIASNRGFSRAVREFCRVPVLGFDEIGPSEKILEKTDFKPTEPHGVLSKKLEERGKSFDKLKADWIKTGHEEAAEWMGIGDIPIKDVWTILDAMKKKSK